MVYDDGPLDRSMTLLSEDDNMPFDETLSQRVRGLLKLQPGIVEKRMFGGLGFLLNGNMCCGIWKEFLILRLGPEQGGQALQQPHVRPFDITGKAMTGWVMVEPDGVATVPTLSKWVNRAIGFVEELPPKESKPARKKK